MFSRVSLFKPDLVAWPWQTLLTHGNAWFFARPADSASATAAVPFISASDVEELCRWEARTQEGIRL